MSVECLLCNKEFSVITHTHLRYVHGVTLDDYRVMFPGVELWCKETRRQIAEANTGNQYALGYVHDEKSRQAISRANMGNRNALGTVQSEEAKQKIREAMLGNQYALGLVHTEKTRREISEANLGRQLSEGAKQKIREAMLGNQYGLGNRGFSGHRHTEETKQALREVSLGKRYALGNTFKHTEKARQDMCKSKLGNQYGLGYEHTEEAKQAIGESKLGNQNFLGCVHTEETKRLMSESHKELWKDSEYAKWMSEKWCRKPNGPECQLQGVLDNHFLNEWKYVGDGSFWVEGKNPDFMNVNGKKCVIEIFGYYWHDPIIFPNRLSEEELIAHYRKCGFECIVFWEFDVYNEEEVVARVKETFN